jgi:HNH endonuclease
MTGHLSMVSKTIATVRFVGKEVPREIGIRLVAQRVLERCKPGPNGCMLWTGWVNIKGYGMTSFHCKGIRTHRAVWEAVRGPVPSGLILCHTCDTPACCNIDHLWLGTIKENGVDASKKRRCRMQKLVDARRAQLSDCGEPNGS